MRGTDMEGAPLGRQGISMCYINKTLIKPKFMPALLNKGWRTIKHMAMSVT